MTIDSDEGFHPRQTRSDTLRPEHVRLDDERPTRRRRSKGARNGFVAFLSFVFSGALVAVLAVGAVLWWGKSQFDGPGPLRQEATFLVPRGGGVEGIANALERNGIVGDARVFEYGVRLERVAGQLKAGEYAFPAGASMREVMNTIRSGNSILHTVTIPEGWTVKQIYARLAADEVLVGELPPEAPEGTLLPETYKFTRGLSRAEIVSQMSAAKTRLVDEIWAGRDQDLPVKDIGEFVTLASIVERETGVASERPHVASVFVNRLREGMRLQSDPTIIYGIWGGAGKPPTEPIRQSHIADQNPYNTYVIRGLPPGPIANPGRASLQAVAHPLDTDDLYFVADGTGGHAFSRTLQEHNVHVRRLREREAQAAAARTADPAAMDAAAE